MDDDSAFSCTAIVVAVTAAAPVVQIVAKASSDQLLCKFADHDPPKIKKNKIANRRKKIKRRESGDLQSLLPPAIEARRRSSSSTVMIKRLGIGRGRAFKTRSMLGDVLRKTWTRTVEGASRVFMEKHYRHKLLINDSATL